MFFYIFFSWKFPITAILETKVRPKKRQFEWKTMSEVINNRREYTKIYKNKLINGGKQSLIESEEERVHGS